MRPFVPTPAISVQPAGSFLTADLPECVAVTAIGECCNYMFDDVNHDAALTDLIRRIYNCLRPSGVLLFDVAVSGRDSQQKNFVQCEDWAVLIAAEENDGHLTRQITSFRRTDGLFTRDDETYVLRLMNQDGLLDQLPTIGFRVTPLYTYWALRLPPGLVAFRACK